VRCLTCRGAASQYCEMCGGQGVVCPTCRGMRWLRTGHITGIVYAIERCDRCRDPEQELDAIDHYLAQWFKHHPLDTNEETPQ
jgi:hypothetical protein